MAFYSSTFSQPGVNSANNVIANLKTAATDRAIIREIGCFIEIAPTNAPTFGLLRMSAVGTGAITTAAANNHDLADGAAANALEITWATTKPTFSGGTIRRTSVPLAVGNGVIWDFTNRGLVVPVSAGMCILMLNATGATLGQLAGWVTWEE